MCPQISNFTKIGLAVLEHGKDGHDEGKREFLQLFGCERALKYTLYLNISNAYNQSNETFN
jgi:hypothetical protein